MQRKPQPKAWHQRPHVQRLARTYARMAEASLRRAREAFAAGDVATAWSELAAAARDSRQARSRWRDWRETLRRPCCACGEPGCFDACPALREAS